MSVLVSLHHLTENKIQHLKPLIKAQNQKSQNL
jgi:hypothetical protein